MQLKQQSEPCVRVAVSIPKDAAQRLRQLAAEGSSALRALGILGVQLDGDSVISLKLAGQDINVNTADNVAGNVGTTRPTSHVGDGGRLDDLSQLLGNGASAGTSSAFYQQHMRVAPPNVGIHQQQKQQELLQHQRRNIILGGPSTSSAAQQALLQRQQQGMSGYNAVGPTPQVFKSPNTICPMEGKVPLPPQVLNPTTGAVPSNTRDFPFESMRQARVLQGRGQDGNTNIANGPTTASGVVSIQPSLNSLTSPVHNKGTQPHQLGPTPQQHLLGGGVVAPPNVALKVVKNPQSGEIVTTIAGGKTSNLGGKSQFLQPPPPPYPGVGVGINATHNNAVGTVPNQQVVNKPLHQTQQYLPPNATSGPATSSNNIAISSPLLVNLLQNDGNSSSSVGNQSGQLIKPLTPTQTLLHQQQSPLARMSPSAQQQQQQHLVNSPMRDFLLQQPQQTTPTADASNLGAIGVPSSPTSAGVAVNSGRNMQPQPQLSQQQGQQQILLSPNNMYNQQQPRFHQQQVTPQQVAMLRHQQMHRQQQMQQQATGGASPQRFIQQQQIVSPVLNQMRQIRPTMSLQHQHPQHQQPFMSSGGMSPIAHSPASSHHSSLHSPLAMATSQQLLSPSNTPAQSPHHHSHPHAMLAQQQLPAQQILTSPMSSQVPPANNAILPPPPDYNQAAASTRWPALNKPMDSATKSSFQEFTRYQMQYNLQQQQINSNQLQNPQPQGQHQPLLPSTNLETPSTSSNVTSCNPSSGDIATLGETNVGAGNSLPDALMALSDLDGLTPNDLDALLPSLSCDLDSTLSLEDKNELESLLQDAKDLDLDLIEENLSAVGVDIGDAATATSLIEDDIVASTSALQTGIEQNLNLSLMQQQNLINCNNSNMQQQQQQQQQRQQHQIYMQQQISQVSQLPVPNQNQLMSNSTFVQQQQQQQQQSQMLVNNSSGINNYMRSASAASNSSTTSANTTQKQLIINPLTGELEPMPSDDSETEAEQETQHLIRPPSVVTSSRVTPASMVSSGSYIPAASEALPNILFSAEEDSNSCSTAISKISEHNNSLFQTSGAGSDTDRSRDSFMSNKSTGRSRKGAGKINQQQQLCNKMGVGAADTVSSTITARSGNNSPLIAGGVTMGVTAAGTNRKSKPNLLREKLQQGVRERKKDSNTAKPKRERNKAGSKTKAMATMASGVSGNIPPITTVASIAETSATNEKIKLRLKIEKSEPVSPAYKVDVSFVPSPKTTIGEGVTSISSTVDSNNVLLSSAQTTAMTTSGGVNSSLGINSIIQSQLNAQMLAANAMQQHQQQQQHQSQLSMQSFNNFNLPSTVTVTATSTSTTSPLNTATSVASGITMSVDEPKVPPLHISLRGGKNSIVIKNSRKDRKKSQATSIPGDTDEDSKSKQLKRSFSVANTTANSVNPAAEDISGASDAKQIKLQQAGAIITQYNGTLESGIKANNIAESINSSHFVGTTQKASNTAVSKTTALLANKNGLTISALSAMHASDIDNKCVSISGATMATSSVVTTPVLTTNAAISATTMSSLPHLLKQQQHHQQSQQSPQLIKTAALPSSITLSTVSCSSGSANATNSSVAHRVIANLHLKNALKTSSATITPIGAGATNVGGYTGGKPLTKNHKPPSYLAAVQQLQLQKQQQQQMAALAEKQTQQQMLAAAAQILPSATTLKRVEINTLTNKIESHEVITPASVATILTTVKPQMDTAEQNPNTSGAKTEICDKNKQSVLIVKGTVAATTPTATSATTTTSNIITQNSISLTKDTSISITEKNIGKSVLVTSLTTSAPSSTPIVIGTSAAIPSPPTAASAAIVTSPILRNSPASSNGSNHLGQGNNNNGSTGGGEDSGIESMDALSEKSPHQQASSSPAQLQVITPPVVPVQASDVARNNSTSIKEKQDAIQTKSTVYTKKHSDQQPILVADDEIEKALAKMEGLQEDNCLTVPSALSPGKLPSTELKINGEHFINTAALSLAPGMDDGDNDDLIKNLTQGVEISNAKSTSVSKAEHENQDNTVVSADKDFKEKIVMKKENVAEEKHFPKDSFKQNIKEESKKPNIAPTPIISSVTSTEKHEKVEVIKLEILEDVTKGKDTQKVFQQTTSINKDAIKDLNKSQQDVLTPISIDIPMSTDTETRIRTRASSRLESPLEQIKTEISPHSEHVPSSSAESSAVTFKKQANPHSVSPQSTTLPNNNHTITTTNTSNNGLNTVPNKDHKRKRSDVDTSESQDSKRVQTTSILSTNSQIISNATKKLNSVEVCLANTSTSPLAKTTVNADLSKTSDMVVDPIADSKPFKKIEESSDSDEPLIEVAEKVRNSKTTPNLSTNSGISNNELESKTVATVSAGTTSKAAISKEAIESKDNASNTNINTKSSAVAATVEKPTRNSTRTHHQQSQKSVALSTSVPATTIGTGINHSNPTVTNTTATATAVSTAGPKNTKQSSTTCSSVSHANTNTIVTTTTTTTTTTATTTQNSNNPNSNLSVSSSANSSATQTTVTTTTTATATTVHATRGVTHSAASNTPTSAAGTNNNNNNSSPVDEKIGTRRSVRASAAANKIIYSRTNAAAAAIHNTESKSSPAAKGGHSNEGVGEARRKTRSAVIGEALLTEGRRRRGSRDFK